MKKKCLYHVDTRLNSPQYTPEKLQNKGGEIGVKTRKNQRTLSELENTLGIKPRRAIEVLVHHGMTHDGGNI